MSVCVNGIDRDDRFRRRIAESDFGLQASGLRAKRTRVRKTSHYKPSQSRLHGSSLLRQHRLRGPFRFLLRLATSLPPDQDFPGTCSPRLAVPKAEELVATPYRHGSSKDAAEAFFLDGMSRMRSVAFADRPTPAFPVYHLLRLQTVGAKRGGIHRDGEHWLGNVPRSSRSAQVFRSHGTWPVRTELANRMISRGTNALASSIVLVCRRRPSDAPLATRREFLTALRAELPQALHLLQSGNIAPVDLAQAAIGPGMAVYTRYGRVFRANVMRKRRLGVNCRAAA